MDDLRELYQSVILDHNKRPRNFREMEDAPRSADGHNPLCGDKLTVYVALDDEDRVCDVAFQGQGCAISTASASLMTEFVKGKSRHEVDQVFERFHELVTSATDEEVSKEGLGKLAVFSGVREYPMRVKCASLAWHTLMAALRETGETAKTE
jgi:nitrogen fixation NifU-like protein